MLSHRETIFIIFHCCQLTFSQNFLSHLYKYLTPKPFLLFFIVANPNFPPVYKIFDFVGWHEKAGFYSTDSPE